MVCAFPDIVRKKNRHDVHCCQQCWSSVYMQYFSVPHIFLQDSKDSWGFLRIPEDSSGLQYNLSNFELEENNSVKSSGFLRTGTEFGRISAKLEYSTCPCQKYGNTLKWLVLSQISTK